MHTHIYAYIHVRAVCTYIRTYKHIYNYMNNEQVMDAGMRYVRTYIYANKQAQYTMCTPPFVNILFLTINR